MAPAIRQRLLFTFRTQHRHQADVLQFRQYFCLRQRHFSTSLTATLSPKRKLTTEAFVLPQPA